jgi:hypothetical protein
MPRVANKIDQFSMPGTEGEEKSWCFGGVMEDIAINIGKPVV